MQIFVDTPEAEADYRKRLGRLTVEEKVALVSGSGFWTTTACERIGLRSLVLSDGPAGVRGAEYSELAPSAVLPNATCLAAGFDPALARRTGELIGSEARRHGVDIVLGPTVNLHRSANAGRNFEAFSEDAQLTADIAGALVDGIQSQGVAATAKHFVGNDYETERLTADSVIDEQTLRRVYALPFEQLVRYHGVLAVMSSFNRINGVTGSESPLLDDPLRASWGFDGLVISDWDAVRSVTGAEAGTDLAMPGPETVWNAGLTEAVRDGSVSEAAVDRKVLSLLRIAARVGGLDGIMPHVDRSLLAAPVSPSAPAVRDLLTTAATAGSVLLRNDGDLLPLAAEVGSIAVIGPAATRPRIGGGGSAIVFPPHVVTPLDGIRDAFPHARITVADGADPHELLPGLGDRSRADDGEIGYDVVFVDAAGNAIGRDRRSGGDLIYGLGYPATIDRATVAGFRVTGRLTAEGRYRLALAGVGQVRLRLDGRVVADRLLETEAEDVIAGLSRPPQVVVDCDLAGDERFEIDFEPTPESIHALRIGLDRPTRTAAELIDEAVSAAREADVAIVCVGTTETDESEGFDRPSVALDPRQDALVSAVAAANPRTVVVLNVGAPVALPWRDEVSAILLSHFAGQEGGTALGRILSGEAEPGGRLTTTWPASVTSAMPSTRPIGGVLPYSEGEAFGYRASDRDAAYDFGHGLGYTTWEIASQAQTEVLGGVGVTARIRNTGNRAGRQTVMVFVGVEDAPSGLRYAGATTVVADPDEEAAVALTVDAARLRRLLGSEDASRAKALVKFSASTTAPPQT